MLAGPRLWILIKAIIFYAINIYTEIYSRRSKLTISMNLPLVSRAPLSRANRDDSTMLPQSLPTQYDRTRHFRDEGLDTTRTSHSELGAAAALLGIVWAFLRSSRVELSPESTSSRQKWSKIASLSRIWNKFLRRPLETVVSLLLSAVLMGIFVAESSANVMSANIVTNTIALVSSPKCSIGTLFYPHSNAAAYSKKCYQARPGEDGCNSFLHQSIEYTEKSESKCPFPGQTCALERNPAFNLDTGMVDARIIGINSASRYQFRRTTTCAPLRPDGEFLKGKRYDRNTYIGTKGLDYDFYGRLKTVGWFRKDDKRNTIGQFVSPIARFQ